MTVWTVLEISAPAAESSRDGDIGRIRAAMAKMKPNLVETLNLRYKGDYSCLEIAKIRGKPLGTVLADLFRARAELKKLTSVQQKHAETQQKKHDTDRSPVLADSFETGDGIGRGPGSESAAGRAGETRHITPFFIR